MLPIAESRPYARSHAQAGDGQADPGRDSPARARLGRVGEVGCIYPPVSAKPVRAGRACRSSTRSWPTMTQGASPTTASRCGLPGLTQRSPSDSARSTTAASCCSEREEPALPSVRDLGRTRCGGRVTRAPSRYSRRERSSPSAAAGPGGHGGQHGGCGRAARPSGRRGRPPVDVRLRSSRRGHPQQIG